eukprot:TRINITY_DN6896_c0_g5_i1.p1 TRINITY_DN6896_c0_g5~~TRINITY_DN6896_c0_g5_i1.p1  ORF type:complete len:583 (-),score=74.08 TRINITY_DN6896_c0_g5_i1:113-1861(-)
MKGFTPKTHSGDFLDLGDLDVKSYNTLVSDHTRLEEQNMEASSQESKTADQGNSSNQADQGESEFVQPNRNACPADPAWDSAKIYEEDIKYAQKTIPTVAVKTQEQTLRAMFVGDQYVGQTSLVNNLLLSNIPQSEIKDASNGTWQEFQEDPDQYLTRLKPIDNEDDHVRTYIAIQSTPALNPKREEQVQILENYIKGKMRSHYERDSDVLQPYNVLEDNRVDALIYILKPQMIREEDVSAIKRLHAAGVAIIVVVNKADCLQADQRELICQDLIEKIGDAMFMFSSESLKKVGSNNVPPFFVVCGNKTDNRVHSYWLVRQYFWGQVEAYRSLHSDFKFFKKLLFEDGFQELKENTERVYRKFCVQEIIPFRIYPNPDCSNVPRSHANAKERETDQKDEDVETVQNEEEDNEDVKSNKNGEEEDESDQSCSEDDEDFIEEDYFKVVHKKLQKVTNNGTYRLCLMYEDNGMKQIGLIIGCTQGTCLNQAIQKTRQTSPTVYDNFKESLEYCGRKVARILISKVQQFSESILYIADENDAIIQSLKSHTSDAVNMAVRFNAPIYIQKELVVPNVNGQVHEEEVL